MLHHSTDRSRRRSPAFLAITAGSLGVAALAGPGSAQTAEYGPVTHEFDIQTKGTAAPRLVFTTDLKAWADCDEDESDPNPVKERKQADVDTSGDSRTVTASAKTISNARASIAVKELEVGKASGEYTVSGDVTLCVPQERASGRAKSWAQLSYIGQTKTPAGKIIQRGRWTNEPAIEGDTGKKRVKDPIVVRITDLTTGDVVREWTALTIENFVHGGAFEWSNDRVVNRAPTMEFEIVYNDGFSRPSTLRVVAELGVVTESVATGVFAGAAVPPVGGPSDFEFDLASEIAFSFDAGLPSTDRGYQIEVEMSSAGEADASAGAGGGGGGGSSEPPPGTPVVPGDVYIHTDLFTAAGGADPLELELRPWMPSDYGVPLVTGRTHAVIPLRIVEGDETPSQLTHAVMRVADLNSDPEAPLGCFVHIRLWPGNSEPYPAMPSASVPVGGDLITDVTLAVDFSDVFCVYPEKLLDDRAPVKEVTLDLTHLPPLPPLAPGERYWLEIAVTPEPGREIFLPLSPYHGGDGLTPNEEASYMFFEETELVPIQDPSTGQLYTLPVVVYGASESSGCYADCDGDGELSFFDFLCFQDAFAAGSATADCDGDGAHTFFDFLCFQNAFAGGCP